MPIPPRLPLGTCSVHLPPQPLILLLAQETGSVSSTVKIYLFPPVGMNSFSDSLLSQWWVSISLVSLILYSD